MYLHYSLGKLYEPESERIRRVKAAIITPNINNTIYYFIVYNGVCIHVGIYYHSSTHSNYTPIDKL